MNTIDSVQSFASHPYVQHLIWVCASTKNLDKFQSVPSSPQRNILIEHDDGIWDAMNKAAEHAAGDSLLFLNARDVLLSPIDMAAVKPGCLLPVEYFDWFGRLRHVKCRKDWHLGIPYCHQGIIFPNCGIKYEGSYKFGADYLYILDSFSSWPLPLIGGPLVHYDNSGISSNKRFEADLWVAKCVYDRFGLYPAIYVFGRSVAKLFLRIVLLPFRTLVRRGMNRSMLGM